LTENDLKILKYTCKLRHCLFFELVSAKNRIVTKYNEEFIGLLGARNLSTMEETGFCKLWNEPMKFRNFREPRRFKANNVEEVKKLFEAQPKDFEGFVVVDKNFNRIKIKSEEYLKLMRIKMLSVKDIFYYILNKKYEDGTYCEIDVEFLKAFPEVEVKIEKARTFIKNYLDKAIEVFEQIKPSETSRESRKEFAMNAIKYPFKGLLFAMLDGQKPEEAIKYPLVEDELKEVIR
jgi:hypothetical protein